VHTVDHPAFAHDVATIAGEAGHRLSHLMVPKVESVDDVLRAERAVNAAGATALPLHVLIESPAAVHRAFEIAAHPRVESISFGLMDFVSAHGGAIPASAMGVQGQFEHPLVVRAKLEIAAACHAHGKVPSHCVVTEFSDAAA
ncbi:aldolase/citrate lyase family protein, partial [Rhizobium sp. 18055]|uniref:aldolase/citrate lyase family protein n=1 Tax=Rhizobium sp. 18055 TaxID=2681403 RepID=UPI001FCEA7E1